MLCGQLLKFDSEVIGSVIQKQSHVLSHAARLIVVSLLKIKIKLKGNAGEVQQVPRLTFPIKAPALRRKIVNDQIFLLKTLANDDFDSPQQSYPKKIEGLFIETKLIFKHLISLIKTST